MKLKKIWYRIKRFLRREEYKLLMDVAHCGLRCAMCPRGGANGLRNDAKGLMSPELFERIIDKFKRENVRIREIEIGNWGEPLLNPKLPEMIHYAKTTWEPSFMGGEGSIGISTTLNYLKDPLDLLESGVYRIRVSISGMRQEVYSKNHIGGDIGRVLKNILTLVDIRDKKKIKNVTIGIGFHDLIYNKEDAVLAEKFCRDHGLSFTLLRMYIQSVEDNIEFHRDRERLSKFYSDFIDLEKEMTLMKTTTRIEKCQYRRSVITVNFDGRLYRCCGVYEEKHFMGSIFDYKLRDIPRIKSDICRACAATPMSWR